MIKMDAKLLVDDFIYREINGKDNKHQPVYADDLLITKCRIDRTSYYYRDSKEQKLSDMSVIFCYEGITTPLPKFKEQSLVVFDGTERVLKKVITITKPYSKDVFAYELEVV